MNSVFPAVVAPSILAADWSKLPDEIRSVAEAGADWLHMDVMDGHFVDNISFGPAFVATAHRLAKVPLDVHLMIERPDHYWKRFAPYAGNITVHVEARHDVPTTLREIRVGGCTAGLSLKPQTPFEAIEPFLAEIDLLLVMTVVPGFGGQAFMPETLPTIEQAATYRAEHGLKYQIQVDGGVDPATAVACRKAGANVFVAGTSFFRAPDRAAAVKAIRNAGV